MNLKKLPSFIILFNATFIPVIISNTSFAADKDKLTEVTAAKIAPGMNVKNLDDLWESRQTTEGENKLRLFVMAQPEVPENFDVAWRVGRLVYFAGNFGQASKLTRDEKVSLFEYGYQAGLKAKKLEPKKVEGYYWYATNLGSYGLAKGIFSALSNAKAGRDALLQAAEIDPTYQWAGPYRILGRYYQEVPGGIISFGDKKIAEDYFKKAINIAPNFRLNTIYLGILNEKQGNKKEAVAFFKHAQTLPDTDGKSEEIRYKAELAKDIERVQR